MTWEEKKARSRSPAWTFDHKLFKTPGGALGDADTGKILYILLPKATIPSDQSVLPTDAEIFGAVGEALMEAVS